MFVFTERVEKNSIKFKPIEIEYIDESLSNDLDIYLEHIGFKESSGRYNVVNTFGYMGMYQFSHVTLKNLGFEVTREQFLSSPELQDSAMIYLLQHNYKILNRIIYEYDGTLIDDNEITKSGILATAHLIGPRRTRILLEDGIDTKDGYGTSALSYLVEFSGYNINLDF
jgi:hypothetical protein